MRFRPPARETLPADCLLHPAFDGFSRHLALLQGDRWPQVDDLNGCWPAARSRSAGGMPLRFVAQDADLLSDGLHYERRICERGLIATREANWHDLFNALVWVEHSAMKAAINRRQAADVTCVGPALRTRAQCALTHFDEAGAVVLLRDRSLLDLWDAHDWHGLFWERRRQLTAALELRLIGHALLEHALVPRQLLVAKCLVAVDADAGMDTVLHRLAQDIACGACLQDPQELRPLPLSGLPGWHPDSDDPAFHRQAPCYRPLRAGRVYPAPLRGLSARAVPAAGVGDRPGRGSC
jgi:hypothetical protein